MRYIGHAIILLVRFITGSPLRYKVCNRWAFRGEAYELRCYDTKGDHNLFQWVRCKNQATVGKLHHDEDEARWNFGDWVDVAGMVVRVPTIKIEVEPAMQGGMETMEVNIKNEPPFARGGPWDTNRPYRVGE